MRGSRGHSNDRGRLCLLLASSSVAALLIGGGAPAAWAAPVCNNVVNPPFANAANISNICVHNGNFTGNVLNTGTVSSNGITIQNATITGAIQSTGVVVGGLSIDSHSVLSNSVTAIRISGATFAGGISNTGLITAASEHGILIDPLLSTISTFAGGITNSGTISVAGYAAWVGGLAVSGANVSIDSFTGGISNSGTIIGVVGIAVAPFGERGATFTLSDFSGGITNAGTISARGPGVWVGGFGISGGTVTLATFAGGVSNSGYISATTTRNSDGLFIGGIASHGTVTLSSFSGGISNSGTLSALSNGIFVGGTAYTNGSVTVANFAGGINNSGTISSATANGIIVGGKATGSNASVSVRNFAGGITNSSTLSGAYGIVVGGLALGSAASVSVSNFTGGITNSGNITAQTGHGILVGGVAHGFGSGALVAISNFAGGISNSGTIVAAEYGILVGGTATGFAASIRMSNFSGGITNSGNIVGLSGIVVGGNLISPPSGSTALAVATFTGGISNSGKVVAVENGIVVGGLAAAGTSGSASLRVGSFSGGITNGGSIRAGGAGILVGGSAFGSGASVTISNFAGGISNSGTIRAGGVGIFLGGVATSFSSVTISTFSGGITNSGTISVRSGAGIVIEDVSTFLGNVWNSGTITARSTGVFICDCATFAGGSIVNTGTISADEGIVVHNFSPVSIFDSGTIVGASGVAVDLTNASGGNTFTLGPGYSITGDVLAFPGGGDTFQLGGIGSGSFDLSKIGPAQQYENFTTFNVVSGLWSVDNTFTQSQPWNVLGGTLAGTGTLTGIIVGSGGTLEPGSIGQPGTFMNVNGNLTFEPGAAYLVNLSPTTASRVNVDGSVFLNGLVEGVLTPGSYSGKTTYDILDPNSISGAFTGFSSLNEPGFGGKLTQNGNSDVLLNLTAQLGSGGGLNHNQQNVANAINTYFNNGGTLPASFFPVFGLSGGSLTNALSQLDGEAATGAETSAFQSMNEFLNLLLDPNAVGGSGAGGPLGFAPDQASLPPDVALAYASVLKAPPAAIIDRRWTTWGAAYGVSSNTDGNAAIGSNSVTASDYGFAGGMEYHLDPSTTYGFGLSGGGTNWNLAQALGDGRSDTFQAGLYAKHYFGPAYVSGALAFGNNWFTTNRTAFAGDQLTASFDGQSYAARLEGGYRYGLPAPVPGAILGVTPYAALQTQWFHSPAYSETDLTGGGFGLSYNAMTANDTRSELGARFDDLTVINGMPLILRGRLAWAHDWVTNPALDAVFQALPGTSFIVYGAAPPKNSGLTTAGVELHITPSWSLLTKFDGAFAPTSQTYAGSGTLRYTW